jgi:biopolymer transport protein TolQ
MHPLVEASLTSAAALLQAAQPDPSGAPGAGDLPKLDPVQLVLHASVPVKAVLVILVLFSVACWLVIGAKASRRGSSARSTRRRTSTSSRRGSRSSAARRSRASSRSATTR